MCDHQEETQEERKMQLFINQLFGAVFLEKKMERDSPLKLPLLTLQLDSRLRNCFADAVLSLLDNHLRTMLLQLSILDEC